MRLYVFKLILCLSLLIGIGCTPSKNPDILYNTAQNLQKQKKYLEAIESYKQLIVKYPHNKVSLKAFVQCGKCWRELDNDYQALKIFDYYIKHYSRYEDMPDVLGETADIYRSKGVYGLATVGFQKIIDDYPNTIYEEKAKLCLAATYLSSHQYDNAKNHYTKFLSTYSNSTYKWQALNGLGFTYLKLGDTNNSKRTFTDIISNCLDTSAIAAAHYGIALNLIEEEKFKEGIAELKLVINKYPKTESADFARDKLTEIAKTKT